MRTYDGRAGQATFRIFDVDAERRYGSEARMTNNKINTIYKMSTITQTYEYLTRTYNIQIPSNHVILCYTTLKHTQVWQRGPKRN